VLQWHTKIKYITELPLAYSLGFMAIDKRAFDKISTEDQAVFREVMTAIYANFDKKNLVDNRGARDALINAGIETAIFDPEEILRIRALLEITNRELGAKGEFTIELYDEMMGYVEEYRSAHP
jgi:TRAP-type C4-dicarboxylate transport system substrate-binding protein